MSTLASLLEKYAVAGPRYTSYPPVPLWDTKLFSAGQWQRRLTDALAPAPDGAPVRCAVYVHLPYCDSLCTFCGCNRQITKKHDVEAPYIDAVLKEWAYWTASLPAIAIAELHLGGGTPSFFSPANLARLVDGLHARATTLPMAERQYSFEGHPGNTTPAHLAALAARGFSRVSFGVQDYDAQVQQAINRRQTQTRVLDVTAQARARGYDSVSHDLVYGLPKQTAASLRETLEATIRMRPDRIAFYSYAHVPWIGGTGQRGFDEADLPSPADKLALFRLGRGMLVGAGYVDVGMDHFALPSDGLAKAAGDGSLHRNFMGYTTKQTDVLIGLGASSISDCGTAFAQNEKTVAGYLARVAAGESPVVRGHLMTDVDRAVRQHILGLMCQGRAQWRPEAWPPEMQGKIADGLRDMASDGLIEQYGDELTVTGYGRTFLRNVCMLFDQRLHAAPSQERFSQTV